MKEEIKQNGITVLSSEDQISMYMIFRNLTGQNFKGQEYRNYILYVALRDMGFQSGVIEYVVDGQVKEIGKITLQKR